MSPRPRERVLANLESIYREAYERAKAAGDQARMADLDAAYQREQLLLEVLLDVRDALAARPADVAAGPQKSPGADAGGAPATIHRLTQPRREKRERESTPPNSRPPVKSYSGFCLRKKKKSSRPAYQRSSPNFFFFFF